MLIKHGRMIMDRILRPLQLRKWICRTPEAVFLGSCALLFGAQLYAQDLLLKEYIYLDGKLLAVERQVLTQVAHQPASDSGKEMKLAQYSPSGIHGLTLPVGGCKPGISVIPGLQETYSFHSPFLDPFLCVDKGQSCFVGSENFKLQYSAYRWHWKVAGISEHKNGGSYDGL